MRLAVTGAAGFIGSSVVRESLRRGHTVFGTKRPSGPVPQHLKGERLEWCELDLRDRAAVQQFVRHSSPDAIIHSAWYAKPSDYLTSRQNVVSLSTTLDLLETAFDAGVGRVVGVGTCLERMPEPGVEDSEVGPIPQLSLYAECKRAAAQVGRALATAAGANLAWARLFHVYGPGEPRERVLPSAADALARGIVFPTSRGEQVRDPIHVSDVSSALLCLAERDASGAYDVALGAPTRLRTMLETLADLLGAEDLLGWGMKEYPPGEPTTVTGDPARLRDLGWSPRFLELRDGLADVLDRAGLRQDPLTPPTEV